MNQAQKIALIGLMILLKALHVIFVHDSTHSPTSRQTEAVAGTEASKVEEAHDYGYDTVLAVILAEFMKLLVSAALFIRAYIQDSEQELSPGGHSARKDWATMTRQRALGYAIPALIYMIEDNLRF
eukprot:scaffold80101_cov42-Prasinocladus_malaysianus.AAC.1